MVNLPKSNDTDWTFIVDKEKGRTIISYRDWDSSLALPSLTIPSTCVRVQDVIAYQDTLKSVINTGSPTVAANAGAKYGLCCALLRDLRCQYDDKDLYSGTKQLRR